MIKKLAFIVCCFAAPVAAETDAASAAIAAASKLEQAGAQLAEASSARDRVAALTQTVQAYEDGLIAMRDGLRRAAVRQATLDAELAVKRDEVARLLGVLEVMGRAPAPLLLLHPSGPTGTARSGMILADVTPALQSQVDMLRAQLEEVVLLRSLQEDAAKTLQDGLQGAQVARSELSLAISDRRDLPQRFVEDPVQTALLLASTETLQAFATGLTDAFLFDGNVAVDAAPNADLPLPVRGEVLRGYNAPDAAGIARPGIIIAGRPRALVTSPSAATILFRGPLLDYGNVVILEPAQGVLFVLAGLADVFGEAGQVIPAGTPIGLLGGEIPQVDGNLTETSAANTGDRTQTLYLEVRDGQSPQDPATWFALN